MRIVQHTHPGPIVLVTTAELSAAFTAWERDFRDAPDTYMSDEERFAESAESYGDACARHLVKVLAANTAEAKVDAT